MDSEFVLGVEPRKGDRIEKEFFVLDCDGVDKRNPLCQGKTGLLSVIGTLSSRSSVAFDVDDDGDLDLITMEWNDLPQVLISDLSAKKPLHFLKIKLVGSKSNRDGIGSWVKVHSGNKIYSRYHDGKSGYLSQSSMPLYFGLDQATRVDRIEVVWASGKTQILAEVILVDRLLTITEDGR